jgi:hypothetical protein
MQPRECRVPDIERSRASPTAEPEVDSCQDSGRAPLQRLAASDIRQGRARGVVQTNTEKTRSVLPDRSPNLPPETPQSQCMTSSQAREMRMQASVLGFGGVVGSVVPIECPSFLSSIVFLIATPTQKH